ncbi:MAG TPA: hypothetical protein VKT76_10955 [Bradyrhizobium sp.]|nr:hypothetical protein [Bradyrhizobium sp.]
MANACTCNRLVVFGLAVAALFLTAPQAFAGTYRPDFVATCENGHSYPVRALAISEQGELVTGTLWSGHHRAAHIRLMPVGFGYRYAAQGLWLDGWRSDADLFFGKHRPVACTVASGRS